jgi:hypothetical protein
MEVSMLNNVNAYSGPLTIIRPKLGTWGARRSLSAEDLGLRFVPPEDRVKLGIKRIYDPQELRVFDAMKKSAERTCLKYGTRAPIGGFVIAPSRLDAANTELEALRLPWSAKVGELLRDYHAKREAWATSNPEWEARIRAGFEPVETVAARFSFFIFRLTIDPGTAEGDFRDAIHNLGDGIFAEIAQAARELEKSFLGKDALHRKALGTFKKIRDKLDCMSFVDPRIQPVVDTIDDWAKRLPKTGHIEGALFNEGHGLALLLGDPEKLARHGAGQWAVQQGDAPSEAVDDEDEAETPAETPRSFDDELEALFGDLDDPEPAASEFETAEAPESETDAEPAIEEECGQEQDETDEALIEDPDPNQSFFWDDDGAQGATDGDDEGPPAEPPPHTRREARQAEKSFFF